MPTWPDDQHHRPPELWEKEVEKYLAWRGEEPSQEMYMYRGLSPEELVIFTRDKLAQYALIAQAAQKQIKRIMQHNPELTFQSELHNGIDGLYEWALMARIDAIEYAKREAYIALMCEPAHIAWILIAQSGVHFLSDDTPVYKKTQK